VIIVIIGVSVSTLSWVAGLCVIPAVWLGGLVHVRESRTDGAVTGQVTILERSGQSTSDLSNAVVYLEPSSPRGGPLAVTPSSILMESRQFVPRVRVVTVGSSVAFPNQDPFRHNVFSNAGPGKFDLGLYGRGESKVATLSKSGAFPIFCNIHAGMVAYVVAVATPYFTQAGSDGRFTIQNVRAGQYALHVWHERGGERVVPLDVSEAGPSEANVQLDARGYQPVPHKNKFGQEYTSTGRDRY
jgi:plastocyanin